jgi:hypothetical protein
LNANEGMNERTSMAQAKDPPPTRQVVWLGQKPMTNRFGQLVQFGQKVELSESQIAAFKDLLGDQGDPRTQAAIAAASSGASAQTVQSEMHGGLVARQGPETIRVAGIEPTEESGRTEENPNYKHVDTTKLATDPISGPDLREQQGQEGGEQGVWPLSVEGKPGEHAKEAIDQMAKQAKEMEGEPSSQPRQEQAVVTGARTTVQPSRGDKPAGEGVQPQAKTPKEAPARND